MSNLKGGALGQRGGHRREASTADLSLCRVYLDAGALGLGLVLHVKMRKVRRPPATQASADGSSAHARNAAAWTHMESGGSSSPVRCRSAASAASEAATAGSFAAMSAPYAFCKSSAGQPNMADSCAAMPATSSGAPAVCSRCAQVRSRADTHASRSSSMIFCAGPRRASVCSLVAAADHAPVREGRCTACSVGPLQLRDLS